MIEANSELRGGLGGRVEYYDLVSRTWRPWGRQSEGPRVRAMDTFFAPVDPIRLSAMRVGRPYELAFKQPRFGPGALLIALDLARAPFRIPGMQGAVLLELPTIVVTLPVPVSANSIRLPIPALVELVGGALATQFVTTIPLALGRPSYDVIGF